MFCLNSLLLTKKKMVTTPVTKASDSPSHGLIKSIYGLKQTVTKLLPLAIPVEHDTISLFFVR